MVSELLGQNVIKKTKSESNPSDLALIVLSSFKERGQAIDNYINEIRNKKETNIINVSEVRFQNGEGKIKINQSVRNKDVYILCDVGNHDVTYKMFGFTNHMSPDDHFSDIKRVISALCGKARRITVIMPLLYASRQHRRIGRESLDCAAALQEFERLGVNSVITFDAHDPNVQNATPHGTFDSFQPTYPVLKEIISCERSNIHKDKMLVISPDTGAMGRSINYANMLQLDIGMFYKRRDYSIIVNGTNPIVEHTYMGRDVEGKSALIVDDMIASGGSIIDIAHELKKRNIKDVSVLATFAFFTEGLEKFEKLHNDGILKNIYSTNLSYLNPELKKAKWFKEVDIMPFLAIIIDTLNKNQSLGPLLDSKEKIKKLLEKGFEN